MAKTTLTEEDFDLMQPVLDELLDQDDVLQQQKTIELLTITHCMRGGDHKTALMLAAGIAKHVRQVIEQYGEDPYPTADTTVSEFVRDGLHRLRGFGN